MPDELLTRDAPEIAAMFALGQWGIFTQGGGAVLTVDSVASVEYDRNWQISDYPQEKGAFESYNKVQVPFQAKVGFVVGPNRRAFLTAVEAAVASLALVSVVTPEVTYPSANLIRYGLRRTAKGGVSSVLVEVWCEEVRIVGDAPLGNTRSPNGAQTQQNGSVQPTTAPAAAGSEPPT